MPELRKPSRTPRVPLNLGGGMNNTTIPANVTHFLRLDGSSTASEALSCRIIVPFAGTLSQLRTESEQSALGTLAFTVRVNGADTALAIAATAGLGIGAVQTLTDLANSVTVAAGDVVDMKVVTLVQGGSVKACTVQYAPG